MTAEQMALVLNHSAAKGTAKVILLGIANHDGEGGAWPSVGRLARYANVSRSNVQVAIDQLIRDGELVRELRQGGDLRTSVYERPNRYEILVQCPPTCDGTAQHRLLCVEDCEQRHRHVWPCPAGCRKLHQHSWPRRMDPALPAGQGDLGITADPALPAGLPPALPAGHKPPLELDTEIVGKATTVGSCPARRGRRHLIPEDAPYCAACGLDPLTGDRLNFTSGRVERAQ